LRISDVGRISERLGDLSFLTQGARAAI